MGSKALPGWINSIFKVGLYVIIWLMFLGSMMLSWNGKHAWCFLLPCENVMKLSVIYKTSALSIKLHPPPSLSITARYYGYRWPRTSSVMYVFMHTPHTIYVTTNMWSIRSALKNLQHLLLVQYSLLNPFLFSTLSPYIDVFFNLSFLCRIF